MCIRDSRNTWKDPAVIIKKLDAMGGDDGEKLRRIGKVLTCLLYTSDAADERSSVDLGGRRIIKKKNNRYYSLPTSVLHHSDHLPLIDRLS